MTMMQHLLSWSLGRLALCGIAFLCTTGWVSGHRTMGVLLAPGTITGIAFIDNDCDGEYDPGTDELLVGFKVYVNGTQVLTNSSGEFTASYVDGYAKAWIDQVPPGYALFGPSVLVAEEGKGGKWYFAFCPVPVPGPCEDCLSLFAPLVGKEYIVNAWASMETYAPTTTHFAEPRVRVECPVGTPRGIWSPSGPIIDGWQRIEGRFVIPEGDHGEIRIQLETTGGPVFFDDVRVFPADASMKSYVYDPVQLRFVAELDDRHFATLYEYDAEGRLVRVKKETERGVMTIQEVRNNASQIPR